MVAALQKQFFIKSIYYDDKSKDLMAIHSLIVVVSEWPA